MAVTAAQVKELREITGAGMVDCKNALVATDGNIEKAIEALREKGLAAVAKKAGRIASEGLVHTYISADNSAGVIVEVNSETDFVAKNADFKTFVENVALQAVASKSNDMEAFHAEAWLPDTSVTVLDALTSKSAVIGEKLSIRRFERFVKEEGGALVSYIHGGGRVAVVIQLSSDIENDKLIETGKNLCMQIAAMSPKFVERSEITDEFIAKEKEILTQAAANDESVAGKPANVVAKIVEGRLNKELKDFCLLEQEYVKDGELTVAKYLEQVGKEIGCKVAVKRFVRFETGEGLEKKEDNFAEEVMKAMQA